MKNKKKFDLGSLILLGINSIIGTGIFLLPGQAYALAGTSSIFVYLFVILLAGSMALCFAEAAGLFKSNGGAYIYVKEAFGNFAGFEVGFMKYIVQEIAWATMAVGFVTALSAIWPAAGEGILRVVFIIGLVGGLSLINYFGVDLIKYFNNIMTIGKLVPLILFITVGLFFIKGANFSPLVPQNFGIHAFSQTAILIFYAFTGFEGIATAAEDMDNPKKNLPIAIAAAMSIVALIYILVQVVSIGTLGNALAESQTPVADAVRTFMGSFGGMLVTIGTLISIGGINTASSLYNPRGCEALAERGMLPPVVAKRSKYGTPGIAIFISAAIVIPIALSGSFTELAAISTISRFSQYIPTCLSVLVFRKRDMKSTFRVPLGPVIPIFATVVAIWLLCNASAKNLLIGLGAMIIIIPVYFLMKKYNRKHGYSFKAAE